MDAWDEAQQEVGRMRLKDPEMAEKLERKMTAVRFSFDLCLTAFS